MDEQMPEAWTHHEVSVRGVKFHYVEAGTGERLVVLLHGFPEFWYSWRHQIPVLANAGFRVIAPDMRGYNLTDKSDGVGHYHIEHLTDDIEALIQAWGAQFADIVGHDWGGMVGWFLAMRHPQVIRKLVIMNAAHPAAYIRELWKGKQLLKSWYVLLFQIPGLAEWTIKAGGYRGITKQLREADFSDDEIAKYRDAWQEPGAMTGGLNYYRAIFRRFIAGSLKRVITPIQTPTLLIWGENDPFAVNAVTEGLEQWVNPLRIERLPGVGHWVQNEAAAKVNELLLSYLR